jgi:pyridoxal phosphate enzyme (YggS family)
LSNVSSLADNIARVQDRIAAAAAQARRDAAGVTLVAVTKTQPAPLVAEAAACGLRQFGENRLEEALPKMQTLGGQTDLVWHLLGHIQSRKAREAALAGFGLIHSVDSLKLAQRLARLAEEAGRRLDVLLECNVSGEASKAGFQAHEPARWEALLAELVPLADLPSLRVRGLMTMAPVVDEAAAARPYFARLRELRDYLAQHGAAGDWRELSMGMTGDFEAAIAEGATLVRIGRAIFGERG